MPKQNHQVNNKTVFEQLFQNIIKFLKIQFNT